MAVERGANLDRFSGVSDTGAQLARGVGELGIEQGKLNMEAGNQALTARDIELRAHNAQLMADVQREGIAADKWKVTKELDQRRKESQASIMMKQAEMAMTKGLAEKRARQAEIQESARNAAILGNTGAMQQLMKEHSALNDEIEHTEGLLTRISGKTAGLEKLRSLAAPGAIEALNGQMAGEKAFADYLLNTALGNNLSHVTTQLQADPVDEAPRKMGLADWVLRFTSGDAAGPGRAVPKNADLNQNPNSRVINSAIAHSLSEVLTGQGKGKIDPEVLNQIAHVIQLADRAGHGDGDAANEGKAIIEDLRKKGVDSSSIGYMISAYHKGLGRQLESGAIGAANSAGQYGAAPGTPLRTPDFEKNQRALGQARDHVQKMMAGAVALGVQGVGDIGDETSWAEKRKHLSNAYQAVLQDFLDDGEIDHPEMLAALPETLRNTLMAKQTEFQTGLKDLQKGSLDDEGLFSPGNAVGQGNVRFDLAGGRQKMDALKQKSIGLGRKLTQYQFGSPTSTQMQADSFRGLTNKYMQEMRPLNNFSPEFDAPMKMMGGASKLLEDDSDPFGGPTR